MRKKNYYKITKDEIDQFSEEVAEKAKEKANVSKENPADTESGWKLIGVTDKDSTQEEIDAVIKKASHEVWKNRKINENQKEAKSDWELVGVFDKDSDPKEAEAILNKAADDVWKNRNKKI